MTLAKCTRCGASSIGGTFEEASLLIDHAVGLSRGIPCGDNYNCVEEIKDTVVEPIVPESTTKEESPKVASITVPEDYVIKTEEASYKNVEGKSEHTTFDEAKPSKKKSKKYF